MPGWDDEDDFVFEGDDGVQIAVEDFPVQAQAIINNDPDPWGWPAHAEAPDEVPEVAEAAPELPNMIEGMETDYPEYPNTITLDRYMVTPKLVVYEREIEPNVTMWRRNQEFTLSYKARPLIIFSARYNQFHTADKSPAALNALEKYSGKLEHFYPENGVWMMDLGGEPQPMWESIVRRPDGSIDDRKSYAQYMKNEYAAYVELDKRIAEYVDSITNESLIRMVGNKDRTHKIFTQCKGCLEFNGMHLYGHLDRKEFTMWLMWSALQSVGLKNCVEAAWKTIDNAREGKVPELEFFREVVRYFFRHTLCAKLIMVQPSEVRTNWTRCNALINEEWFML